MKSLVVEDSRLAREGLVRMLGLFPQLEVIGQADHPATARPLIDAHRPDVIFLDIHMPGESGFDLLEQLDYAPRIVFTTAHSEYAIRSFDYHTVDYLLKPISPERLAVAVGKLSLTTEESEAEAAAEDADALPALEIGSRIFVKDADRCHLISLEQVRYIESCKNYVRLFFGEHKVFVKKSLSSVEARLPRSHFFRVSRQHIVNLQAIRSIDESVGDGLIITMSDGQAIEVSRRNAMELREMLSF